jgi:TM2 domain-containing membrane protein YozV
MSQMYQVPPRCYSCGYVFTGPAASCPVCGAAQAPNALAPTPTYVIRPQKSVALAVILSIIWLGLGHLYLGRIATGIILAITDLILVFIAFTWVGLFVAIPAWAILIPVVTILAGVAAQNQNRAAPTLLR